MWNKSRQFQFHVLGVTLYLLCCKTSPARRRNNKWCRVFLLLRARLTYLVNYAELMCHYCDSSPRPKSWFYKGMMGCVGASPADKNFINHALQMWMMPICHLPFLSYRSQQDVPTPHTNRSRSGNQSSTEAKISRFGFDLVIHKYSSLWSSKMDAFRDKAVTGLLKSPLTPPPPVSDSSVRVNQLTG